MIPTPKYRIAADEEESVYDPAEDTFLLMDALESHVEFLQSMQSPIIAEIGCGSGVVSAFARKVCGYESATSFATDLNLKALNCTQRTAELNNCRIELVQGDLLSPFSTGLRGQIDVLLFNPPYVPTENEASKVEELCYAGGQTGRSALDRLLPEVPSLLSRRGRFYVVALKSNDIPLLMSRFSDTLNSLSPLLGLQWRLLEFLRIHFLHGDHFSAYRSCNQRNSPMGAVSFLLVVGFFTWVGTFFFKKIVSVYKCISGIQGPPTWPVIGNLHQLHFQSDKFFEQAQGIAYMFQNPEKGKVARVWLSGLPFVLLYGPKECEAVLGSSKMLNKPLQYSFLSPWIGEGLLISKPLKWRPRRKLLTPAFHYDILKDFVGVYNRHSNTLLGKFEDMIDDQFHDIFHTVTLCTLDIICEAALGTNINAQKVHTDYLDAVFGMKNLIFKRQLKPQFYLDFIFDHFGEGEQQKRYVQILHDFTSAAIMKRKAKADNAGGIEKLIKTETDSGKRRMAFLDLMLDMHAKGELSLEGIHEEVDTFTFEGHDTTSASINWFLHLMGANPEIQTKVHREIDEVLGSELRDITYEDIGRMKYLEACIKETLRLYPSVPIFARQTTEEVKVNKVVLPAGIGVVIVPSMVHRDPEYWPDPEVFNPERFMDGEMKHPYCYIPFSAGSRNCIGQRFAIMEEKCVLANVLRSLKVESKLRTHQMRVAAELIIRPISFTLPMSYNYAGQPPYQQGAYNPNMNNPYQQAPTQPGWNVNNPQQGGYMPPPPMAPRMMNDTYVESGNMPKNNLGFSDQTIRAAFIRKVFTMVAIMLGVVAIMTAIPFIHQPVQTYIRHNIALYWVSYVTFLGVYIALMCCESVRRSFPSNLIMTAILTLAIGYMTMMICSMYNIVSVLLTLIITTICCGSIIIFSATTKRDLTSMMGIVFIFSMVLMIFGLVAMLSVFIFRVTWLYTIYAGLAALLFMFYLAIDIQMIMGGRKFEISPEDHIYAAIQVFLDIIYIFWMLLSLIGGASNN
ncbi:hypothetical protein QR680_005160 [Steinernema hermaphroditum]|uniref:Methyltransferase HEMK2 n=1 Tax=Steinernema hermaphroditum TaxID=289476 RepID=A0AA39HR24_9BILA|nr:hypothetical protein QR680_005160 [Steinernema hermaphroditum]